MNAMLNQKQTELCSEVRVAKTKTFKNIYNRSGLTKTLAGLVGLGVVVNVLIGATVWALGSLLWSFLTWEHTAPDLPNQITRILLLTGVLSGVYLRCTMPKRLSRKRRSIQKGTRISFTSGKMAPWENPEDRLS